MVSIQNILDSTNKKYIGTFVAGLSIISLLLTGCKQNLESTESNNSQNLENSSINISVDDQEIPHDDKHYYKIYTGESVEDRWYYYYDLFDEFGNIIKHECTFMDEPNISLISDSIVKVSVQSGTGRSTQWTYYYNVKDSLFSPVFYYTLNERANLVAYFDGQKIIIRDVFDDKKYYKEIELQKDLSKTTDPIENAIFSTDLKQITVFYVSGPDFQQTSEIINL